MNTTETLMSTALSLFAKQGFKDTTIQQIAEHSNISKGGFYNHFSSKQDLLLEMIEEHHDQLINHAAKISASSESLASYIAQETEAWVHYQTFFKILWSEINIQQDQQITEKMNKLRLNLQQHHRNVLYRCYGVDILPYMTDLLIMLEGVVKEYIAYIIFHDKDYHPQDFGQWIQHHFDSMMQRLYEKQPFLGDDEPPTIDTLLVQLRETCRHSGNGAKLLQAIDELERLIQSSRSPVLLDALLYYLKSEPLLQIDLLRLERLLCQEED